MSDTDSRKAKRVSPWRWLVGLPVLIAAAERHRLKTGAWPASIAAIDRNILPSAPVDPFTGQAFHMERRDGQFIIYSIGPNLRDEHGALDRRQWMSKGPDDVAAAAWGASLRRRPPDPSEAAGDR